MKFNSLLGVTVIYLIDRADLFKISNLVLGGEVIVMDLNSSLEEQKKEKTSRSL
jgi:hypothetical protein